MAPIPTSGFASSSCSQSTFVSSASGICPAKCICSSACSLLATASSAGASVPSSAEASMDAAAAPADMAAVSCLRWLRTAPARAVTATATRRHMKRV
eukprot:6201514-Pleurochrysis_carterae.AAC.2